MGALAMPVAMLGSSVIGGLFGRSAQNRAAQLSPMEQAGFGGIQNAATGLGRAGNTLFGAGLPGAQQSMGYWSTLLQGNRAAMAGATAAPTAAITDQAQGMERNLERSGVRGAVKDLAKSQIAQDTGRQIMGLTTGVQPTAAQQLGSMGVSLAGQGTSAMANAGSLWGGLLGQGFAQRKYAREEGAQAGSAAGGLIFDILRGAYNQWGWGGSGKPNLTTSAGLPPYVMNLGAG